MKHAAFRMIGFFVGAGLVFTIAPVQSQDFPTKPVRIVTTSPGSTADITARLIAPRLNEGWRQPVIVDNRSGPIIPAEIVARSPADGHTVLMGQFSSHASAPSIYKNLQFDPVKDFAPVTLVAKSPLILVSHLAINASNVTELIDYAKKRPGKLRSTMQSKGSSGNLTMVLFNQVAKIETLSVPYRTPAASLTALLARESDIGFMSPVVVQASSGKLRVYAITSARRFSGVPELPTMAESGFPGFESSLWYAIFAPAQTPQNRVSRLNRDITRVVQSPTFVAALLTQGADAVSSTPDELGVFVRSEIAKWGEIIRAAGIQPE